MQSRRFTLAWCVSCWSAMWMLRCGKSKEFAFFRPHHHPFVLSLSKDRHPGYTQTMPFHTYMLRCNDGSYYTGHTDNLETRIAAHIAGAIPGYTAERLPVVFVWSEEFPTREEALASERRIKGWSRAKKEALTRGDWEEISRLARNRRGG